MKTVFFVLLMVLISTAVCADIANYGFRVSTERNAVGKFINFADIPQGMVSFEYQKADGTLTFNPADGVLKVYSDEEIPDSNPLSTMDQQVWYVTNELNTGRYKVTFKASDAGIALPKGSHLKEYGFSYSRYTVVANPVYTIPVGISMQLGGSQAIAGQ